jgi:hypothetical protein
MRLPARNAGTTEPVRAFGNTFDLCPSTCFTWWWLCGCILSSRGLLWRPLICCSPPSLYCLCRTICNGLSRSRPTLARCCFPCTCCRGPRGLNVSAVVLPQVAGKSSSKGGAVQAVRKLSVENRYQLVIRQTVTFDFLSFLMRSEKLRAIGPNLNRYAPRSSYAALSKEFPAVAARLVDKCREELLGRNGSYRWMMMKWLRA